MARSARRPRDWDKIVDAVRFHRADMRCECNWQCQGHKHAGRCAQRHGITTLGQKQATVLKVVLLGEDDDFRPESLLAMCGSCEKDYVKWRKTQAEERERMSRLAAQMDSLFPDLQPVDPMDNQSRED